MKSGKRIKILLASFMLSVVLLLGIVAMVQTNINSALKTNISISAKPDLQSHTANEGEAEPLEKPAYFNIFKLIFGFLPSNSNQQ